MIGICTSMRTMSYSDCPTFLMASAPSLGQADLASGPLEDFRRDRLIEIVIVDEENFGSLQSHLGFEARRWRYEYILPLRPIGAE